MNGEIDGVNLDKIIYAGQDRQVSWRGVRMAEGDDFETFISTNVSSRFHDEEGSAEFESHLQGLANTGFARQNLHAIMEAEIPEQRTWAVGEAMAEAYLEHEYQITWPWNMARDRRNPDASLPGADLVGFKTDGADVRLVLGEVKTSTDSNTPPSVMSGRSGMVHQIDNLASNIRIIGQLLKWLLPRCKNTNHEAKFNAAVSLLLDSGNKAIALFGVLIRDTEANELDLRARCQTLAGNLQDPVICNLIAIYLPCAISDFALSRYRR